MILDQLTTNDVESFLQENDPTAVLPIGSTEQHGQHLPLNTDIYLAEQVAQAACEEIEAVMLPPFAYGYNEKELMFAGTISLSAQTLLNVIIDIGHSLARAGWRRFLIVNGHGWNNDIIRTATHILNEHQDFTVACCSYWVFGTEAIEKYRESQVPGGMAHACEFETSLMMYLCPDAVRLENIKDEISYLKSDYHHHDLFHKSPIFLPERFDKLSSSGVIGTPSLGSAKKGKKWFETIVKNLKNFLIHFRTMYPAKVTTTLKENS